ncbi:MAG: ABC transporter ATP-binding protein/permease [Bacilli bacterium]|nr:ABC transporter ATP-binding protein/permease [Bacilli bacterium]
MKSLPKEMENLSLLEIFRSLPEESLSKMVEEFTKQFEQFPESIARQSAIAMVKVEYQKLGMNIDQIQTNYIFTSGAKMLGIALLNMTLAIAVGFFGARTAAKLARDLRNAVFRKTMEFGTTEFKSFGVASLITRTTNDIQQVQMVMVFMLRTLFYAPIIGIGGVIKAMDANSSMAWIIAVAVLSIMTLMLVMFTCVMPKFKVVQKLIDRLNQVTREILSGIPVIRAFSNQKKEEKRFDEANRNLRKTTLFVNRAMTVLMPTIMFVMNAISILIVWKGAHGIDSGAMQVGDMLAFIQYTMQIVMAFIMVSMFSIMFPRANVSANRIAEVLKTEPAVTEVERPKSFSKRVRGLVEFKNVNFRYPDSDEDVLTDISFTAEPGKTTAFIGSTGSGKSTLINLIPRFFDVSGGEILVDGVNIKDVKLHELHNKIGFVPQKGILFSGTIASNIGYGKENITDEEIVRAARIAQAESFIEEKKEKYDSPVAQGGTNVSGGQKQRLSIARAIASDPEIYIFDDSFSALDFKTDAELRKALSKETKDATVLIVAQRISTILHADQIIVLNEGKIVGKGTHKQLLKSCAVYKEIASSQLTKEELENE